MQILDRDQRRALPRDAGREIGKECAPPGLAGRFVHGLHQFPGLALRCQVEQVMQGRMLIHPQEILHPRPFQRQAAAPPHRCPRKDLAGFGSRSPLASNPLPAPKSSTKALCVAKPRASASAMVSSIRRLLPMPASPRRTTTRPRPSCWQASIRLRRRRRSVSRPTKRLAERPPAASPATRQATTGLAMPFRCAGGKGVARIRPSSWRCSPSAITTSPGPANTHQPRGKIDGIAQHRIAATDPAGDDLAHGDPDMGGERCATRFGDLARGRGDIEGRGDRTLAVVAMGDRCTEERHHGIADMLVDAAAVSRDDPVGPGIESLDQMAQVLGIQPG